MLLELGKLGVQVPLSTQIAKQAQTPGTLPPLGSPGAPSSTLDKPAVPAVTPTVTPTEPTARNWFTGLTDPIIKLKAIADSMEGTDPAKLPAIIKALEGTDPAKLTATIKALEGVDLSKFNFSQLGEAMEMFKGLGVDPKELPGLLEKARGAAKYMNADGTPNFGELLSGGLKSVGGLMKENPLASAAVVGGLGLGAYSLFGNKGNNNNNNNQQTPIQPQVPANQWMANLTKSQGRVDAISPTA